MTGVSAGALIAPFAFLGPEYDAPLKTLCTEFTAKQVYAVRPLVALLAGQDSIADTTPLAGMIARMVDANVLAAVARAHGQGRRLLIGTTNLDARRPVFWDMGAIAASGKPGALELFRNVMRASAAIPVAFQPVYIPVEANGARYDEMHVDGGVTGQVFFYGSTLDIAAAMKQAGATVRPRARIYIVRNAQFQVEYEQVKPSLLPIAARSLVGLTGAQGVGDLYRIYAFTQRDGIDFNATAIPQDYVRGSKEEFDPQEMKRLFEAGFQEGRSGVKWQKHPPGLPAPE